MELNEYQKRAMETCLPESENFAYMILNLVGELGEFASKIAKSIRKGQMVVDRNDLQIVGDVATVAAVDQLHEGLKAEAGDILWQLSGLCSISGWSLEEIACGNLVKLASRKERGEIDGNGDNR